MQKTVRHTPLTFFTLQRHRLVVQEDNLTRALLLIAINSWPNQTWTAPPLSGQYEFMAALNMVLEFSAGELDDALVSVDL